MCVSLLAAPCLPACLLDRVPASGTWFTLSSGFVPRTTPTVEPVRSVIYSGAFSSGNFFNFATIFWLANKLDGSVSYSLNVCESPPSHSI